MQILSACAKAGGCPSGCPLRSRRRMQRPAARLPHAALTSKIRTYQQASHLSWWIFHGRQLREAFSATLRQQKPSSQTSCPVAAPLSEACTLTLQHTSCRERRQFSWRCAAEIFKARLDASEWCGTWAQGLQEQRKPSTRRPFPVAASRYHRRRQLTYRTTPEGARNGRVAS